MKKIIAMVLSVMVLTTLTVPVFAQEVTDPNKVIKEEVFNAEMSAHETEFHNGEIDRANNYIKYLDGVIYNLNQVVNIKQEVVTNYIELAKVNSYYSTLIPQAERDLAQAKAWVEYYKAYKTNTQMDFKTRYNY